MPSLCRWGVMHHQELCQEIQMVCCFSRTWEQRTNAMAKFAS